MPQLASSYNLQVHWARLSFRCIVGSQTKGVSNTARHPHCWR